MAPSPRAASLPPPRDLKELTSIRFFAAFFVVLFHAHYSLPWLSGLDTGLIRNGYLGVDLFFILSGAILTHVNFEAWQAGQFRFRSFLMHRFARIYPVHLMMFLIFLAVYAVAARMGMAANREGANWSVALQHLLLVHAWGTTSNNNAWNGASWSISAEFFAYLCFPIYLSLAARFRPVTGLALSVLVFAAFYGASDFTGTALTGRTYDFGILRILPEFLMGVFLYRVLRQVRIPEASLRWLLPATALACLLALHLDLHDVAIVLLLAGLVFVLGLAAFAPRNNVMRAPALIYLGEISYSTYMVHFIFLLVFVALSEKFFGSGLLPLWFWLLMILGIYLASALSYRLVEVPARRAIRAWLAP